MGKSSRQKISRETLVLNNTVDLLDLMDMYRTLHPKTKEYTFFSSAHETFSRIEHMLCHKRSPSKYERIEIISNIFSDHSSTKLKICYRKKNG